MAYGTAPHRVAPGVWVTRKGRRLTEAGSRHWEHQYDLMRTDGRGHMNQQSLQRAVQKNAMRTPTFEDFLAAKKGDKKALRLIARDTDRTREAEHQRAYVQAQTDKNLFGQAEPAVKSAYQLAHPVARSVLEGFDPIENAKIATRELSRGHILEGTAAAASIVPFGPGRGFAGGLKAARALRAAERAGKVERALTMGAHTRSVPPARSWATRRAQAAFDAFSRAHPEVPVVGSEARVTKGSGRDLVAAREVEAAQVSRAAGLLPKEKKGLPGRRYENPVNVAHYFWHQLPEDERNVEGLRKVRRGLYDELDRATAGQTLPRKITESASVVEKTARVKRLQKRYDKVLEKSRKVNAEVRPASRAEAEARLAELQDHHDALLDSAYERLKGGVGFDPVETARRNAERARARKRSKNKREGMPGRGPSTQAQELRAMAQNMLDDLAERNPGDPQFQAYVGQRDELAALRRALDESDPVLGEAPVGAPNLGMTKKYPRRSVFDPTVTKYGGALSIAKDELETAKKVALTAAAKDHAGQLADLPRQVRDLGLKIAVLDRTIKARPTADPRILAAMKKLEEAGQASLEGAGYATPVERTEFLSRWLGLEPTGEEGYIGHRLPSQQGMMQYIRARAFGKPKSPPGAGQEHTGNLLRGGANRMSTHILAEDWSARQTFRDQTAARSMLHAMGEPYEGVLPDGYYLINKDAVTVPTAEKIDQLAELAAKGDWKELDAEAERIRKEFLFTRKDDWEKVVQDAAEKGHYDQLRIIKKKDADRFYKQILPAARETKGGWLYDRGLDATSFGLIFFRLGYIPKAIVQNLVMVTPHQGPFLFPNLARAGQLIPGPGATEMDHELWDVLSAAAGIGSTGIIGREAASRPMQAFTGKVLQITDSVPRISALLHEAAKMEVISTTSFHLSDEEKAALHTLFTGKGDPEVLKKVRHRANNSMGDFGMWTPQGQKWARRFLIVPGWLAAGTKYPFWFAANYPIRSAALAYLAAGEPGSPRKLNRPIDEYLREGLPSWVEGVGIGKDKTLRINSVLPASIGADVALRARHGEFPLPGEYRHPLPEALWNLANSQVSGRRGSYRVPFLEAARRAGEQLQPNVRLIEDLISPNPRSYPGDRSRAGRLLRESGVWPVEVTPEKKGKKGKHKGKGSMPSWYKSHSGSSGGMPSWYKP